MLSEVQLNQLKGPKNVLEIQSKLFNTGYFDKIFLNLGLSNKYTLEDLDILDDYFRNKRDMPIGKEESFSRIILGIYICKIFENNVRNSKWSFDEFDTIKDYLDYGLVIELKNDVKTLKVFPLVALGKIAFAGEESTLSEWFDNLMISI